jgi:hypothetical protein
MSAAKRGGRPVVKVTATMRERVMTGAAIGMDLDAIAAAVGVSRASLCRYCKDEVACGRAKRTLENAELLRKAAASKNVSAMRTLAGLYAPPSAPAVRPLGKKEQQRLAAERALVGSEWEKDLDLTPRDDPADDEQEEHDDAAQPSADWGDDLKVDMVGQKGFETISRILKNG